MNKSEDNKNYVWSNEQEQILKKWGDKALCLKIMHERSYKKFWCLNAWFNIPVIIISTITGTGNFASGTFGEYGTLISFVIGGFNIFAGILATIATYTTVSQKVEAHKFSLVNWDKFSRKIQIELSKSRKDRIKAYDFIKNITEEYDRLIEMSPIIPDDIIRWFNTMIETGNLEDNLDGCLICCNECFCFPCGMKLCCPTTKQKNNDNVTVWKSIELPDILGKLKPIDIARENNNDSPPPIIIVENKNNGNNEHKNEYNIYENNNDLV
jgi:hypothetical protein